MKKAITVVDMLVLGASFLWMAGCFWWISLGRKGLLGQVSPIFPLALIAISITPLLSPVERNMTDSISSNILSSHKYEEIDIRGSMTLLEIEETTGVPREYIIETLKLPESVSKEERLGVLKRKHGFEMNAVREAVKEYKSR